MMLKFLLLTSDEGTNADEYEGLEPVKQPVHDDEQKRTHGSQTSPGDIRTFASTLAAHTTAMQELGCIVQVSSLSL
jgi:hypothetical protein